MPNQGKHTPLDAVREWVNLRIYNSKNRVIKGLRYLSVPISIAAVAALVVFHGFKLNAEDQAWVEWILKGTIGYYIFKYVIEFFYSFNPRQYLRESKWEGVLMGYMLLNIISINLLGIEPMTQLGQYLGFQQLDQFFMVVVQGYFLLFIALEVGKASSLLAHMQVSPPGMLVVSFILLGAIGTGLLLLPEMTTTGKSLSLLDASFTTISAICVTGLSTFDISSVLSFKGQMVLMVLIQLGGLNFISFASLLALFSRNGMGLRYHSLLQSSYSAESLESGMDLFKQVYKLTFTIEALSAVLLYFSWGPELHFDSVGQRVFFSVFHSISAFNNAGFALFPTGLMDPSVLESYGLHLVIAFTLIAGGLGFSPLREVFSWRQIKARRRQPWKHLSVNTRLAFWSAAGLLLVGTAVFAMLEYHGTLRNLDTTGTLVASFFQSATARTAGFNTLDFGAMALPTIVFFVFLMFIGGNSGSTAGGIKTSTFALVFLSALSTIRGETKVELLRTTIPLELLRRAFSVFLFSISLIFVSVLALTMTDAHFGLARLLFEEVSAFCTVGLSTGITSSLSATGKVILMVSMFVGRVGTVTLAFALSKSRKESATYRYPDAQIEVG
jgi:potassium uptake TrkH family protein